MGNIMKVMKNHNLPFIPYEIIFNILKRLPVKSLIRFQCVCKDWKNLINSPSFIQDHLHHTSHQNPLLLFTWQCHCSFLCQSLRCGILNPRNNKAIEIEKPPLIDSFVQVVASSNGLVCVKVANGNGVSFPHSRKKNGTASPYLLLGNPASRQFRKVPRTIKEFNGNYSLGYGFTPIDNDYKIVRIYVNRFRVGSVVNPVEVYSLKSGSWKEIEFENLEGTSISRRENVIVNGVMYWLGGKQSDDDNGLAISIDLTKQVCTSLPLPHLEKYLIKRLVLYKSKPALVAASTSNLIHLWMMEEDTSESGERWIWSKKYTCSFCAERLSSFEFDPITIWKNEIVFRHSSIYGCADEEKSFCLLNLTTNEFEKFVIKCARGNCRSYNYVESLVSVGSINNKKS